jgi:uncharacterized delta-60 repeat protein
LNPDGTLDTGFNPGADATVTALALQPDGKIVVGGSFTNLSGQTRSRIGRLNPDGTLDTQFSASADDYARSIVVMTDGKLLVGGSFTNLAGRPSRGLGRLTADGTLDTSFGAATDYSVTGLAVQDDGRAVVVGSFDTLAGVPRQGIGRLKAGGAVSQSLSWEGSTVTWTRAGSLPEVSRVWFEVCTNGLTWSSLGVGVRVPGGWQLSDVPVPQNARLRARGANHGGYYNGSTWFLEDYWGAPWSVAHPQSQNINAGTTAGFLAKVGGTQPLRFQWYKDGVLLADGGKVSGANTAELRVAEVLRGDAGGYRAVVENSHGSITSLVAYLNVKDPAILKQPEGLARNLGQSATLSVTAAGTGSLRYQWYRNGVALVDGARATGTKSAILELTGLQAADGGNYTVAVTGDLGTVTSSQALVIVNIVELDPTFAPGANDYVDAVAITSSGGILVGGKFKGFADGPHAGLALLNADGVLDRSFGAEADAQVDCFSVQPDGKILVGGYFASIGGQPRSRIARLNPNGTVDPGFNPGANDTVHSLALQADGKIVAGGYFTSVGGQARNRMARLNPDGTLDPGFDPAPSDRVFSVVIQPDGKILLGGTFTTVAGQSRSRIARLNADGTLDTGFNPVASDTVYCMALQSDGKILVGGNFYTMNGQYRYRTARLLANGTLDSGFTAIANSSVFSMTPQADGRILVGGWFVDLADQPRRYIGRLGANGALDPTFNPGADNLVYFLAPQVDGTILVGGDFHELAGQAISHLGRLMNTEPATQQLTFDGSTIQWMRGGSGPEVFRTQFESTTDGASWTSLGVGTRIAGGWRCAAAGVPANATIRARGFTTGGRYGGSGWFVESLLLPAPVIIAAGDGFVVPPGKFGFTVQGAAGKSLIVEVSADMAAWVPVSTNALVGGRFDYSEPIAEAPTGRFYRARYTP